MQLIVEKPSSHESQGGQEQDEDENTNILDETLQSNTKANSHVPDIHSEQIPPKGDKSNEGIRNVNTAQIPTIIEEEVAGEEEVSTPEAAPSSDEGKKEATIVNFPSLIDGIASLDDLPKEIQEIHDKANLINSPTTKNDFFESLFLLLTSTSA